MRTKKATGDSAERSVDPTFDLLDLAQHLRKEYVLVSNEKTHLQRLNEKVSLTSCRVFNTSYISREQRLISLANTELSNCFAAFNRLESVQFIEAHKKLGSNESQTSELFSQMRKSPELLAKCLISYEKSSPESIENISQIILSSLYANCILNDDKVFALNLMKHLICLELSVTDNPRRLLRYNWCAFSHIYRIFCDQILEAKPFLTAALYEPVMQLLAEDDLFLDIDPNRAAVRFPASERIRHFGKEGTQLYYENLQKYRIWTLSRLANLVTKFVDGIHNNIFCFPQSLSWVIRQIYNVLIETKVINVREIIAICSDLIFSFFICPAILNPDLLGITDAHVSHISRFNLQQIAQIIQILALSKWEEMDSKLDELYSKVSKEGITKLLDHILEKRNDDFPHDNNNLQFMTRSSVLISEPQLKAFLSFIKLVNSDSEEALKKLKEMSEKLMDKLTIETNDTIKSNQNLSASPENSPRNRRSILNRVTKSKSKPSEQLSASNADNSNQNYNKSIDTSVMEVLVIPIANSRECPGMLSEEKVLKAEQQKRSTKVRLNLDLLLNQNEETESVVSAISGSEKRTRFSLSQDQESVGTSDNLEAISEAASNHSVESSLDSENENDNMSDMVSANVSSGRATPNVSGRDTPSSHSPNQSSQSSDEEGELEPMAAEGADAAPPAPPPSVDSGARRLNAIPITQPDRPSNRDDIEDKFGKFDIKPIAAVDETKSMLSDTWSTDVLGSDSEAFEQTDGTSNLQASAMNMFAFTGHQSQGFQSILDASETASQSDAWSTDVLTSDTERLQEFDPDETASVTRSEPEDDFNNMYEYNVMESPKNATLKQRNVKFGPNPPNYSPSLSQDLNEASMNPTLRPKSIPNPNMNSHKMLAPNKPEPERNAFTDPSETTDHFPDSFPMSLSPTLLSHNMQSLGRLSFDVRKFDEDLSVRSLFQDNNFGHISTNLKANGIPNNTTLVSELLSLDLNQEKSSKPTNVELNNSLIDFENDISVDNQSVQCFTESEINSSLNDSTQLFKDMPNEATNRIILAANASAVNSNASSTLDINSQTTSKLSATSLSKVMNPESTGAIPKTPKNLMSNSIRLHQYSSPEDDISRHSNRKGFFKLSNFKSTFKEKMRSFKDKRMSSNDDSYDFDSSRATRISSDFNDSRNESSDEILAKYRAKSSLLSSSDDSPNKSNIIIDTATEDDKQESTDPLESLNSTKKKLRKVFGSIDLICLPAINDHIAINTKTKLNEVTNILKILLAEAISTRQSTHSVLLHETLRSIQSLDERTFQKLFWSLKEDYKKRNVYIAYLTRSRQQLLSTLAYFETIIDHIEREKSICSHNLISISVKQFLERKERSVQLFIKKFQSLIAADEKTQLVDKFMGYLENCLTGDLQWQSATDQQIVGAKPVVERYVMSQIYMTALYPNGDGDVLRDQILHKHIQRLSTIITPNHKDLGIPKIYHAESPWPSAQQEMQAIGAHKTPRDKVKCVSKCCANIMTLLSLAYERSVPAADDLMPVLVFVLIKANPPSLLSTVQYVNSFYEKHFEGEDAYWWTQFCSAIEFIKTMD